MIYKAIRSVVIENGKKDKIGVGSARILVGNLLNWELVMP